MEGAQEQERHSVVDLFGFVLFLVMQFRPYSQSRILDLKTTGIIELLQTG